MWVNGHFLRVCHFRYTLADGLSSVVNEGDPELQKNSTDEHFQHDLAEIDRLRELGQRELVQIIEYEVEGSIFRCCTYEYTLSDGRKEITGEGDSDPNVCRPVLSREQQAEVHRLRRLEQGEFLGFQDREINGYIFSMETYKFTLTDGTVVTHTIGWRKGRKAYLTKADLEELDSLKEQGAGEFLEVSEREVLGKMFSFERRRYILRDNTEVILSVGKPLNDR